MRCARVWRFVKMLKRAGIAYDPGGVAAAKEGSCAVACPACPQRGLNLREDNADLTPLDSQLQYVNLFLFLREF